MKPKILINLLLQKIILENNKKLSAVICREFFTLVGAEGSCLDKEQTRKIIEISREELVKRIA